MSTTIAIIVAVVMALYFYSLNAQHKATVALTDNLFQSLKAANIRHGTDFPIRKEDLHLTMGNERAVIAFDPKTKRIALVTENGSAVEVLDFSFIRTWKLCWTNYPHPLTPKVTAYKDVHFEIGTNDLKRPLIKIFLPSKAAGDQWHSRLGILLNA